MGVGGPYHPRPLYPEERDPIPIVQKTGWAPGPTWTGVENLASTGIRAPPCPSRSKSLSRPTGFGRLLFIYCNLFMSNYSLFSNVSASQTIYGRCFLQMQRLLQLRWSLPLLTSAQVMVMLYRNKKRHFMSVVRILSLWLYYLYRRLRTGQVPSLLISCPLPSSCEWFSFLFIVLSITTFFGLFLILPSLDLCGNVLSVQYKHFFRLG